MSLVFLCLYGSSVTCEFQPDCIGVLSQFCNDLLLLLSDTVLALPLSAPQSERISVLAFSVRAQAHSEILQVIFSFSFCYTLHLGFLDFLDTHEQYFGSKYLAYHAEFLNQIRNLCSHQNYPMQDQY